jgi:hypothetical protein
LARIRQARRCHAHRKDGQPCGCYAINGGRVCRIHGGAARQVRAKADERLLMAAAYRAMVTFMNSPSEREHAEMREQAFRGRVAARILEAAAESFEAGAAGRGASRSRARTR